MTSTATSKAPDTAAWNEAPTTENVAVSLVFGGNSSGARSGFSVVPQIGGPIVAVQVACIAFCGSSTSGLFLRWRKQLTLF